VLLTGDAKNAMIDKMCDDGNILYSNYRKGIYEIDFDCTTRKVKYARLTFIAGGSGNEELAEGEKADFDKNYIKPRGGWYTQASMLEAEIEKESKGKLRIMLFAAPLLRSQFMSLLMMDMFLSIFSLVLVWAYIWFMLESIFLAFCGIFEIIFSLPVAMSIWTVILNQQLTFQQTLVLYMILGIGADDVFVLYDAWQQARFVCPDPKDFNKRFAWAYRRAFWAMAVTTSTTCGSFVIGATSPLPSVRDFCIFAAVVVFVDWIFCITFFSSAVVVYEKHFAGAGCLAKSCGIKTKEAGKCMGPGCCWGCLRCTCTKGGTCWKVYSKPPPEGAPMEKRGLEKFCEGPLFDCLAGLGGKVAFVFWLVMILVGIILCGTMLGTAEKTPPIGRPHIDVTRSLEVLMSNFPNFQQPLAFAVWGLDKEEPIDSWGKSHADDTPKYGASGANTLVSPEGQMQLLTLCRAADLGQDSKGSRCGSRKCLVLGSAAASQCTPDPAVWRKYGVYMPQDQICSPGHYCFMEEFARFWAWSEGACNKKDVTACGLATGTCLWDASNTVCYSTKTEFDYAGLPNAEFLTKLGGPEFKAYKENRASVLRAQNREYDYKLHKEMTGYELDSSSGSMRFAYIGWNATFAMQNTANQANEWYDRWETFFTTHGKGLGGFQTTQLYLFMVTQNEMVRGAIMGIILSLVIAFIVLVIATKNWWIAGLGIFNIIGIVVVFLGLVPLLGWSLGEYECIFMIATVGLSVDYTAHLLHAYNHVPAEKRIDRARGALAEMGISVLNSAITTLAAAFVLFFCGFHFFFQFGAFIFIIILLSIVMSITFLMPLMCIVGPEGEQGKIPMNFLKSMTSGKTAPEYPNTTKGSGSE
jgi:hypothetical protein